MSNQQSPKLDKQTKDSIKVYLQHNKSKPKSQLKTSPKMKRNKSVFSKAKQIDKKIAILQRKFEQSRELVVSFQN